MLISDIPTDTFNQILADLQSEGWEIVSEYDGFDAWIDYGHIVLCRDAIKLDFEWTNWFEGSIDGPDTLVQELQTKYSLEQRP